MAVMTTTYDPARNYDVLTPNTAYKGMHLHHEFINGHSVVEGPGAKANAAEVAAFEDVLNQFVDAGYTVQPSRRPRGED